MAAIYNKKSNIDSSEHRLSTQEIVKDMCDELCIPAKNMRIEDCACYLLDKLKKDSLSYQLDGFDVYNILSYLILVQCDILNSDYFGEHIGLKYEKAKTMINGLKDARTHLQGAYNDDCLELVHYDNEDMLHGDPDIKYKNLIGKLEDIADNILKIDYTDKGNSVRQSKYKYDDIGVLYSEDSDYIPYIDHVDF